MKAVKYPQRMCVGCGEMHEKRILIRIVKEPEGGAIIDITGKKSGRGAYLCKNDECLKKALKMKKFEKILGISKDDRLLSEIAEQIK